VPGDDRGLSPGAAARAAGLVVEVRRRGWRLRRWTAKEAIAATCGGDSGTFAELEIGNRPDGAPVASRRDVALPGCLSLTDRAGWAVCALAPAGVVVGCDLELVEPRSPAFVSDYLTAAEQRLVASASASDTDLAANLVWSAKESALKVLGEGLRRPTRSVEVEAALPAAGSGRDPWQPMTVRLAEGGELTGWWRRLGPFVLTLAAAPPSPPPRFLGGPVPD
jgi:4'-phosphopantetheinyl transferase